MKKQKLGNTEIEVSEVAFGGVEIGVPYGIGVKSEADMLGDSDAIRLLHSAADEGINFFDTARLYGESERIMGEAFHDRRQDIALATKCRHLRKPDGKLIARVGLDRYIRDSLTESLTMLQTDYIDLYMVHYADMEILEIEEVAAVFTRLKEKGVVRAIGVSVYKPEETKRAISNGIWDAIQLPFNLMDQSHGVCFGEAYQQGVGVIVRSVLMRGMLTDRSGTMHSALAGVEKHIAQYRGLAKEGYTGLSQLATRFALAHEAVSSVLVGIDKQQYLLDAVDAMRGSKMDNGLRQRLQQLAYPDPSFLNLAQWDKNGWI